MTYQKPRNASCIAGLRTVAPGVVSPGLAREVFGIVGELLELTTVHWRHGRSNARELGIEVTHILLALDHGNKRRGHSFVVQIIPVDALEVCVVHDLLGI